MTIEQELQRIATALELIAARLGAGNVVSIDGVEHVQQTITAPPLAWFDAGNGCAVAVDETHDDASGDAAWIRQLAREEAAARTAQTTWEWLGITPPATRARQKMPESGKSSPEKQQAPGRKNPEIRKKSKNHPGREPGTIYRCGRCRRERRRRMNGSDRCVECQHEEWWDE